MAELRDVIGVQRKAQTAWPCRGMDKGCNAAMRVEDECKPSSQVWHDTRQQLTTRFDKAQEIGGQTDSLYKG